MPYHIHTGLLQLGLFAWCTEDLQHRLAHYLSIHHKILLFKPKVYPLWGFLIRRKHGLQNLVYIGQMDTEESFRQDYDIDLTDVTKNGRKNNENKARGSLLFVQHCT